MQIGDIYDCYVDGNLYLKVEVIDPKDYHPDVNEKFKNMLQCCCCKVLYYRYEYPSKFKEGYNEIIDLTARSWRKSFKNEDAQSAISDLFYIQSRLKEIVSHIYDEKMTDNPIKVLESIKESIKKLC